MKKKNRRNNAKYPALDPSLNLKTRTEVIDFDYTNQLPDKLIPHCSNPKGECSICNNPKTRMINPKKFLNKFAEEYINDKIDRENLEKNLVVTTVALKKENSKRNNARNHDIHTRQKATGLLKSTDILQEKDLKVLNPEEKIIQQENIEELKLVILNNKRRNSRGNKKT
jgi:hypothetical protein